MGPVQGSTPNLQGGNISVQGSTNNPQPAASIPVASGNSTNVLQQAQGFTNSANAAISGAQSAVTAGNNESNTIANLLQSIQSEEQANAPGTAASLNINALQASANQAAQNSVNPLYTQYLNQYMQESAAQQQAAQSQNTLNLQGEQTGLANTLNTNQLQSTEAANTNALTQGNINTQQQNYQLQTGNAQNAKMQAIQQSIGSGNLGASGLGQQQLYNAENSRNVADAAQSGQFQYQRDQGNLSTQDTFDQLALQSQQANTAEGQAESQTNFNLNDYLRQAAANDTAVQESLASSQQQAITAAEQNNLAQGVQGAINSSGVSGKNLVATNQAYSPYLQTTSMPSVDIQNYLSSIPTVGSNI